MLSAVLRKGIGCLGLLLLPLLAVARLPPEVYQALERAKVPPEALVVVVQEVGSGGGTGRTRLSWQPDLPVNPASVTKLLTTYAALDLLGPAWSWVTPVWLNGTVHEGVLYGDLVIKGSGDPKLVHERVWLMLRRVQQLGVREIRGDIVLDRSAFSVPETSPAEFDGEPLRAYNVRPDALLLNYKTVTLGLVPDAAHGVAQVITEPTLAGVRVDSSVPLSAGPCDDWRAALQADFSDPLRIVLAGSYPLACGERAWALAYAEPAAYNARLLAGMWAGLGGTFTGTVRDGTAPVATLARPSFELVSPALSEVVREINKFSNNVMALQLFLTLGLVRGGAGTPEASREVMRRWLTQRLGKAAVGATIDNGSGLSRDTRLSASQFARLLQAAWAGPVMPELIASLPVSGQDGTLVRSRAWPNRAHLKTGSLRDVVGLAGYVLADSGKRMVLVAVINHPNAAAARPALEALLQWTALDNAQAPPPPQSP